jgi:hypothetical protein
MASQVLTLEECTQHALEEILHGIAEQGSTLTIIVPNGRAIVIASKPCLKPLPESEGSVPQGWEEAVYARS